MLTFWFIHTTSSCIPNLSDLLRLTFSLSFTVHTTSVCSPSRVSPTWRVFCNQRQPSIQVNVIHMSAACTAALKSSRVQSPYAVHWSCQGRNSRLFPSSSCRLEAAETHPGLCYPTFHASTPQTIHSALRKDAYLLHRGKILLLLSHQSLTSWCYLCKVQTILQHLSPYWHLFIMLKSNLPWDTLGSKASTGKDMWNVNLKAT